MASLRLSGVTKQFGSTTVIHGVDLDIADGEFVVFVGPSGCGKSTLLRMISGLEAVTAGDLHIDGQRVNDVGAAERGLAMVFQSYALYPHMTVYQNMAFGLENIGTPRAQIDAKVNEAARLLQLEALLERRPMQLSGGQRQRVAIGRAIVREPSIFLFDEPLSNLDAELRVQMRSEITALHRRLKTTMIYVTHDQVEAMTMADRILVLRAGRVEQIGAPLDLYNAPANRFVAGFIGSPRMNFLAATVTAVGHDGLRVRLPAAGAEIALAVRPDAVATGDAVTLGVRPEHVRLGDCAPGAIAIAARLQHVEQLGANCLVTGLAEGEASLTAQLAGQPPVAAGEAATLSFLPDAVHVFRTDDGERALTRCDAAGSA